eukprot:CAMPEP_0202391580 /NCGR_PEP_ID=MMETSP1127-20130417/91912_1 /ASSEMBLY_ACC=CAM_ASM_000462 /TAXON_ID=3047 /ORGANISM="Dunaliella tertiolecta, Strain CCMP1320" /LENGTH=293 /DNA_ID=CAMNT_0048994021 /DNA_START=3046 /DNA_END=3927 /DNA_ORIENTATION=+
MTHCIPTNTTVSALGVAILLKDHVWKLHGYPENFVTDRDSRFTSIFWKEQCGIKSHMSTAYHPQTDGQTERMNRILKDMLRHYVSPQQDDWDTHLAAAEFAINNSYQESIKTTPFCLDYGRDPRTPLSWAIRKPSKVPAVEDFTKAMQDDLQKAKAACKAQHRQKSQADKKQRDVEFSIGDEVMLSSKNIKLRLPGTPRLMPKWIGPLKVIERVNPVAYRLELPPQLRIHDVFHVSLLKPFKSDGCTKPPPFSFELDGEQYFRVERIVSHRVEWITTRKATPRRDKVRKPVMR